MNTLTKRVMRLAVMGLGFTGLFVAFNAIPGAATPPVGLTNQLLGKGTYASHTTLPLRHGSDIVVAKITVAPGGSSGWHSHPGGAIVIVQQGQLTVYASIRNGDDEQGQSQSARDEGGPFPHCVITTYTQGQSFVERPGELDQVVNSGSTEYVLVAVFPSVPVGGASRIDQPNPGTCPI
jgi:quercetin dioxygenase-like cupin family protein